MPHLEIQVIQARQLAVRDSNGTSDPYVVLSTTLSNNNFRSKVVKRDLNPWWGETVTFTIKDPAKDRIRVDVFDKDLVGKDRLGSLELGLSHLEMGRELVSWYTLTNIEQGEIQLGLKAVDFGAPPSVVSAPFVAPYPVAPGVVPVAAAGYGYYPPPVSGYAPAPIESGFGFAQSGYNPVPCGVPSPSAGGSGYPAPHIPAQPLLSTATAQDKDALEAEANKSGYTIGYGELRFERKIGSGGFGEIWKGEWAGTTVAIKKILNVNMSDSDIQALSHEISLTSKLRHPHIVPFLGACFEPEFCLVLDFCDRGSLFHVLGNKSIEIDWPRKLGFCIDSAKGLLYLHTRNPPIVHRDVKSLNILVTAEWKCLVSDFGLTKVKEAAKLDTRCGSPAWSAPEILRGEGCTEKADVFSYGIVLWEILTRSPPYPGVDAMALIGQVAYQKPPLRPPIPPEGAPDHRYIELMVQCWDDSAANRPDFQQIVDRLKVMIPQTPPH